MNPAVGLEGSPDCGGEGFGVIGIGEPAAFLMGADEFGDAPAAGSDEGGFGQHGLDAGLGNPLILPARKDGDIKGAKDRPDRINMAGEMDAVAERMVCDDLLQAFSLGAVPSEDEVVLGVGVGD